MRSAKMNDFFPVEMGSLWLHDETASTFFVLQSFETAEKDKDKSSYLICWYTGIATYVQRDFLRSCCSLLANATI